MFIITLVVGYLFPELMKLQMEATFRSVEDSVQMLKGKSYVALVIAIFFHNFSLVFLLTISGISFGVLPIYYLCKNGLSLGYVLSTVDQATMIPVILIESFVIILGCTIALRFGVLLFNICLSLIRRKSTLEQLKELGFISKKLILPYLIYTGTLVFVAAIIESISLYSLWH